MIKKEDVPLLIQQVDIALGKRQWKERVFAIIVDFLIGLIFFIAGWLVAISG
jgi:hypothetical protein